MQLIRLNKSSYKCYTEALLTLGIYQKFAKKELKMINFLIDFVIGLPMYIVWERETVKRT